MVPQFRRAGWSTTPPPGPEPPRASAGRERERDRGDGPKSSAGLRARMFNQQQVVEPQIDLSTARTAEELAQQRREERLRGINEAKAQARPKLGTPIGQIGGVLEGVTGVLPFGLGERVMGLWQAQELGLNAAAPRLRDQISALLPGADDVVIDEVRLRGYTTTGEPIYDVDVGGTWMGQGISWTTQMRIDPSRDQFIPRTTPSSGDILLPAGGGELTEAQFRELMDNASVARAMAAFESGTLGEAGDILSGQLELVDRITAATGLSIAEAEALLARAAGAVAGEGQPFGFDPAGFGPIPPPGFLEAQQEEGIDFDSMFGFGGGGGGGGGAERLFQASDAGLVEDWVRNLLVALVGVADDARVQMLLGIFQGDERAQFDGAAVDPRQSVRERIREFQDYKAIHRLRPAHIQEDQWIGRQFAPLEQEGVRLSELTDRAILQAQVGVSAARAGEAATLSELAGTGRALPRFMQQIEKAASSTFRRVN